VFIAANSVDPNTAIGGTWEVFGEGRVLIGQNAGDADFDTLGETGGAKTHTLIESEIPSHTHVQDSHQHGTTTDGGSVVNNGAGTAFATANASGATGNLAVAAATATNQNTGGDGAHNNMPPYIVVKFWNRTA
jgi:microcystin-dependent protein